MTKGLFEPEGPDETGEASSPVGAKLLWFAGIALVSVLVVALAAYTVRGLLFLEA